MEISCYLFVIVNFLRNLWAVSEQWYLQDANSYFLPSEELVMKEKQFRYIGKGKSCSNCSSCSRESLLCSPGTWDELLVPIDGCRIRLQCLETSRSLCDISVSNKWVYYWQWNANEWSILIKSLEMVFTWGFHWKGWSLSYSFFGADSDALWSMHSYPMYGLGVAFFFPD